MTTRKLPHLGLKIWVVVTAFGFTTSCRDKDRELKETRHQNDSLTQELEECRKVTDSVQQLIADRETAENHRVFYGREFEEIDNPEEYISSSLRNRTDLIDLEPVLGGSMEFREINVLTEEWVLARYDDGHVQGSAIYSYKLQPDGSVSFEVITIQQPG